jgi:hypothetical protein
MNGLLQLVNASEADVSIVETALVLRGDALMHSKAVVAVTTENEQGSCVAALRALKGILKRTEESREMVKAPVLALGRKIDSIAKEFVSDLAREVGRLERLLSDYQAAERRKAEAAERARQEELARLEAERLKAEETERCQRESALRAERLAAVGKLSESNPFVERAKAEEAALVAAGVQTRMELLESQGPAVAPRASGMSVRDVWFFECTDIRALYAARPDLVRIEPATREINAAMASGMRECQGLRIWKEVKAGVRGGAL